jgi:hypothetical protein
MGQIRKIQKNKKERMDERKIRDFISIFFTYVEVPILVCSPLVGNTLGLFALVQLSLRRTHLYGNLPYNLSSFPALLVILRSNPLSSLGGKKF